MNRTLIALLLVFLASCAAAPEKRQQISLDDYDVGVYGVIHKDGALTDKRFRLVRGQDRWKIEDQRADGTWEDVTCEESCVLVESTEYEIKKFMGGEPPQGMWASCLHNSVFAFCKVVRKGSEERRYVFLGFVADNVVPVNLMRIQ